MMKPTTATPSEAADTKLPWITPVVEKMCAGDAEAGPNPIVPEGAFAFGS